MTRCHLVSDWRTKNPKLGRKIYREDVWVRGGECTCVYAINPSFPDLNQRRGRESMGEGGQH